MKKYYILSLKWTQGNHYVWWKPDDKGYTYDLSQAGIYSEDHINKNKNYYSNTSTMPVPCETVEKAQLQTVAWADTFNHNLFGITEHLRTAKEI